MAGKKPDYILKLLFNESNGDPQSRQTKGAWRRLGAAWVHENETRTIGIKLDSTVPITLPPDARLILVPPRKRRVEDPE